MKMTDTNDKKQIARKPLSLSSSGRGSVRQSFAGGRSKAVVVEKKKKVIIRPGSNTEVVKPKVAPKISIPPVKPKVDEVALAAKKLGLSKGEYEKRQSALSTAKAEADVRDAKKNTEQAGVQEQLYSG